MMCQDASQAIPVRLKSCICVSSLSLTLRRCRTQTSPASVKTALACAVIQVGAALLMQFVLRLMSCAFPARPGSSPPLSYVPAVRPLSAHPIKRHISLSL